MDEVNEVNWKGGDQRPKCGLSRRGKLQATAYDINQEGQTQDEPVLIRIRVTPEM